MFSALPHAVGLLRSDCAEFTRISAYRNKLNNIVREKNGVMLEYIVVLFYAMSFTDVKEKRLTIYRLRKQNIKTQTIG